MVKLKWKQRVLVNDYAEFIEKPGKIFTDFEEVRREIQAQTDSLAGSNKVCHIY